MEFLKRKLPLIVLGIMLSLVCQAWQAKADTVTSSTSYTYSTDLSGGTTSKDFDISQFDTLNGTLQLDSVTITLSGVITSSTISITVDAAGRAKGDATTYGFLTLKNSSGTSLVNELDLTTANGSYVNITSASTTTANSGYSTLSSSSASVGTSGWVGLGTVTLSLGESYAGGVTGTGAVSANASETAESVSGTATVTVTYNYSAVSVVPEPSTWAMLFGGLGMLIIIRQTMKRRLYR